jgi:hypothetical protein
MIDTAPLAIQVPIDAIALAVQIIFNPIPTSIQTAFNGVIVCREGCAARCQTDQTANNDGIFHCCLLVVKNCVNTNNAVP